MNRHFKMARSCRHLNALIRWLILASYFFGQVDADVVGWSYDTKRGGPSTWKDSYPDCAGLLQSPINIVTEDAEYHHKLQYININNYSITDGVMMRLENKDGHTAEVVMSGKPVYIQEGSLPDVYKLEQFHFHWGAEDGRGSEHSIDGKFSPMELHLVHFQDHLGNIAAASTHPFGLAVFAFLFKVVPQDNIKLNKLLKYFPKIVNASADVEIETFALRDILPDVDHLDFYRYDGSLTTPPCSESVIWSVAVENIEISQNQLNLFRNLSDDNHASLVDDFRPIQPEHNRLITTTLRVSRYNRLNTTTQQSPKNNDGSMVTACLLVLSPSLLSILHYSIVFNYFQICH
ncbi:unnamed protein product [Lymnaea stagnalis]|uniref:carbonic anhydrase n=1 Tax=Lymnaea stagnalis TaxID=6523 RepID=A0AAV2H6Z3_LYMST